MKKNYSSILFTFILIVNVTSLFAQFGKLDNTFGTNGKVLTMVGNNFCYGEAVVIQPDGKIIVAGSAYFNATSDDFMAVRYNSNGTLDNTFSGDGKTTTDFKGYDDDPWAVALQSDGKILVAGMADSNASTTSVGIVRYNSDGSPDSTFSGDGKAMIRIYPNSNLERLDDIIVLSNGKIMAVGSANNGMAVMCLNSNGSLDMSFNGKGWMIIDFQIGGASASSVAAQADGKIVIAGTAKIGTGYDFAIVRIKLNGTIDSTFGIDGKVNVPVVSNKNYASSIAIQADGKIVVGGYTQIGSDYDWALIRVTKDGLLDNGFSGDGKLSHSILSGLDAIEDLVIQFDGKILATGYAEDSSKSFMALVRYNDDGSFDNSFGTQGKVVTTFGDIFNYGNAIALQKDGKIIAVGTADNPSPFPSIAVARYISGAAGSVIKSVISNVSIYPNPFNDFLNIKYNLYRASTLTIQLYDMQGRMVLSVAENKYLGTGQQIETINLQSLPLGMYNLIICTSDSKQTCILMH